MLLSQTASHFYNAATNNHSAYVSFDSCCFKLAVHLLLNLAQYTDCFLCCFMQEKSYTNLYNCHIYVCVNVFRTTSFRSPSSSSRLRYAIVALMSHRSETVCEIYCECFKEVCLAVVCWCANRVGGCVTGCWLVYRDDVCHCLLVTRSHPRLRSQEKSRPAIPRLSIAYLIIFYAVIISTLSLQK